MTRLGWWKSGRALPASVRAGTCGGGGRVGGTFVKKHTQAKHGSVGPAFCALPSPHAYLGALSEPYGVAGASQAVHWLAVSGVKAGAGEGGARGDLLRETFGFGAAHEAATMARC